MELGLRGKSERNGERYLKNCDRSRMLFRNMLTLCSQGRPGLEQQPWMEPACHPLFPPLHLVLPLWGPGSVSKGLVVE